jgi:hypothetical protein
VDKPAGMAAAQARCRAIERQARERTEAGLPLDELPDLSADCERDGFYQAQLIRELAVTTDHEITAPPQSGPWLAGSLAAFAWNATGILHDAPRSMASRAGRL